MSLLREGENMNQSDAQPSASYVTYVLLYVNDVAASLAFYEKAFGLARRFFHDDNGKAYGELETGATRLAFDPLRRHHLNQLAIWRQ
jgi:catechol 2,3-dioxygenase-like lactoylglutathione lyase family enzyme